MVCNHVDFTSVLVMFCQVPHIEKSIPDFKKRNLELLISETNPGAIRTMEEFEVKIITYEHMLRMHFIYIFYLLYMLKEIIKFSVL